MGDYISRDEALAVFGDIHPLDYNAKVYANLIRNIPAANVIPVSESDKQTNCKCYHAEKNFLGKIGVCWGTKECEACSCGGDEAKCDFYDYVRDRSTAKKGGENSMLMSEKVNQIRNDFKKFCARHNSCDNCRFAKDKETDCFYLYLMDELEGEEKWQAKRERKLQN